MRPIFSFLFLLILSWVSVSPTLAQSPSSIAGRAVVLTVNNGSYPFATSGSFRFLASATDDTFVSIGISGAIEDTFGTFSYSKNGANNATVTYSDINLGSGFTASLNFSSATSGTYTLSNSSLFPGASQSGTFAVYNGNPPSSLTGWTFLIQVDDGLYPFASSGSCYFIPSLSGNSYEIDGISGIIDSSGTYAYSETPSLPSASTLTIDDSVLGLSYTQTLSWQTSTSGAYVITNESGGAQAGTFIAIPPSVQAPSLYFQNGLALGLLSLNSSFLPTSWSGIGTMSSGWQERATVDLNDDGNSDIIFQNGTQLGALLLDSSGVPLSWVGIGIMGSGWELRGAEPISSGTKLFFQNGDLLGVLTINVAGVPIQWNGIGAMTDGWELRAVADLNGDGVPELIFQNGTSLGALQVSSTTNLPSAWFGIGAMSDGWILSSAVDVDGDGQPDLIFQNGTQLGALQVNTSLVPIAWHGIGSMGAGWTLPGDY